jgi:SpoVK/Ycf46/Vps4 family AAA+-type ATPase
MLRDAKLEEGFDFDFVIEQTAGLSGSDIKEVCRNAAMNATREYIRAHFVNGKRIQDDGDGSINVRPLRTSDFFVKTSSQASTPNNIVEEIAD